MTETLNLYQKNWRRLKIIENEKLISSLGFELTPIDLEAHYKINSFISSAVKSYKQQELLYMHDISSSYCSMTWWDEVKSILKKNVQGDKLALLFWNRLTEPSYHCSRNEFLKIIETFPRAIFPDSFYVFDQEKQNLIFVKYFWEDFPHSSSMLIFDLSIKKYSP